MKYFIESSGLRESGEVYWQQFTLQGFDTAEQAEEHRQMILRESPQVSPDRLRVAPRHTLRGRFAEIAALPGWSYERINDVLIAVLLGARAHQIALREVESQAGLDHVDAFYEEIVD